MFGVRPPERGFDGFVVQVGGCGAVCGFGAEERSEGVVHGDSGDLFVADVDAGEDGVVEVSTDFIGGVLLEIPRVLQECHACFEEGCTFAQIGFKRVHVRLDDAVEADLITTAQAHLQAADDRRERAMDSGFEGVKRVFAVNAQTWASVYKAASEVSMPPTEKNLVELFGLRQGRVPSDRQAAVLLRLLDRMAEHGVIGHGSYQ